MNPVSLLGGGGSGGNSTAAAMDAFKAKLQMQITGMAQANASQNAKAAEKQIQDHKKKMDEIAAEGQ